MAYRKEAWNFSDFKYIPPLPEHFQTQSLCYSAPINWFFPSKGAPPIGKKLCTICPVQPECLNYAIDNQINHGLWGGMTERERFTERAKRRTKPATTYDKGTNADPSSRPDHAHWR